MTERLTIRLWSPTQAAKDLPAVWQWIKAMLVAAHDHRARGGAAFV